MNVHAFMIELDQHDQKDYWYPRKLKNGIDSETAEIFLKGDFELLGLGAALYYDFKYNR